MRINSISDFRKAVRYGPYAWPGGYPLYWVMGDGGACKFEVCKAKRREMLMALASGDASDAEWRPIALEVNWEDAGLYCDHTGSRIPSAYAEDDE